MDHLFSSLAGDMVIARADQVLSATMLTEAISDIIPGKVPIQQKQIFIIWIIKLYTTALFYVIFHMFYRKFSNLCPPLHSK